MNDDELLSARDAALIMGVDPQTIKRWVRAGRVKAFKTPGGHIRITRAQLRAFLEGTE